MKASESLFTASELKLSLNKLFRSPVWNAVAPPCKVVFVGPGSCVSLAVSWGSEGCEVGQWSEWGSCTRRNKTCCFQSGLETRTRHIDKKPPKAPIPSPTLAMP